MASDQAAAVVTRLEEMERKIQALEDANEIRNLKAAYAAACDDNYNPDKIAELFTEDAHWEAESLGQLKGREEIREFFRGASDIFTFAIHYALAKLIDWLGVKIIGL